MTEVAARKEPATDTSNPVQPPPTEPRATLGSQRYGITPVNRQKRHRAPDHT
jgi:hypothetical protein